MSAIEALYIFDRFAPTPTIVLQHEWRSRSPTSPTSLLAHYNAHLAPRPALLYVPTTTPPTLLFSFEHNNLLLLSPATSEIEPLLVLEFLHRVVDVLEDYLGPPLIASKIEGSYDIVAQLLCEMADDGIPFTTEPNALRDLVLPPSLIGKLFGSVTGLPGNSLSSISGSTHTNAISTIPWRRANVKHTNNELYVDVIELITATIAPSGRPLSARANGTIAFTSKLSGVPDLLLTLQAPNSHKQKLGEKPNSILQYPVFHPCVRLSRWRDHPGELSFVPPDGKFVLASYEVNLLPSAKQQLQLPVTIDMKTAIGPDEDEFEVRVFVNTTSLTPAVGNGSSPAFGSRSGATRSPAFGGSSNVPVVEEVAITIPLPPAVKTLVATRCSRGEFHHEGREVLWKIPTTGSGAAPSSTATFRTGVQIRAMADDDDDDEEEDEVGEGEEKKDAGTRKASARKRRFKMAMPRCAIVNFSVKGWLASGVLREPFMLISGFFILFVSCIVYMHVDLSISKSSASYLAKLQWDEVRATIQQVISIINQCLSKHERLEASLHDLSRTGDVQACKTARKTADSLFKEYSKELKPLLSFLQSSPQATQILPKVEELVAKEKELQERLIAKHSTIVDCYEKKIGGRELENRVASHQQKVVALKQEVEDLLDYVEEI